MTAEFDRWWADEDTIHNSNTYQMCRAAFLAGAAAERIECVRRLQRMGEPASPEAIAAELNRIAGVEGGDDMLRNAGWTPMP